MKSWSCKTGLLLMRLLKYPFTQLDYLRYGGLLKVRMEQINWIDLMNITDHVFYFSFLLEINTSIFQLH